MKGYGALVFIAMCAILVLFYSASYNRNFGENQDSVFPTGGYGNSSVNVENVKTKTLNILAFGDSLTAGYYEHGVKYHPYSIRLKQLIEQQFEREQKFECVDIHQKGRSGEKTDHMIDRLDYILHSNASHALFDIVCILGGTNDLVDYEYRPAFEIFKNLKRLYQISLETNPSVQLVVMSIPKSGVEAKKYIELRTEVNKLIREFVAIYNKNLKVSSVSGIKSEVLNMKPIIFVDIERLIPYNENVSNRMDKIHWDDTLHMTPAGYDLFGTFVFEHLMALL